MDEKRDYRHCQDQILKAYKKYKEAPHLTFEDNVDEVLSTCLSFRGHYHENRKEYLNKVKIYNYNDYICKDFQQKQMDLLWKEADTFTKLRMLLG